jgi:hypothetical protein
MNGCVFATKALQRTAQYRKGRLCPSLDKAELPVVRAFHSCPSSFGGCVKETLLIFRYPRTLSELLSNSTLTGK